MFSDNTNVCVFCGGREGSSPAFVKEATEFGERLAEMGFGLVYGAGRSGIMGAVSNGALSKGGNVIGVIPQDMWEREDGDLPAAVDLSVVGTIHERKKIMYDLASAFVTLPGGLGTLEEFFESTTWSQLNYHAVRKPSYVLNINGYYNRLKDLFDGLPDGGFIGASDHGLVKFFDKVDDLMAELLNSRFL